MQQEKKCPNITWACTIQIMLKKAYKLAGTKIYQPRRLAKDQSNQAWKNNCHTLLRRHGPD